MLVISPVHFLTIAPAVGDLFTLPAELEGVLVAAKRVRTHPLGGPGFPATAAVDATPAAVVDS